MKSLVARLQQPVSYLKETVEKVAEMPKTGRFALKYTLKPEFRTAENAGGNDDEAPGTGGMGLDGAEDSDMADVDGDDDDDEDIKLEDVMPS